MIDDFDIIRTTWSPTRAEMDAYMKREVEMACDTIRVYGVTATTLHSSTTMKKAAQLLAAQEAS